MNCHFTNLFAQQLNGLCSPVLPQTIHGIKLALVNQPLANNFGLQALFSDEAHCLAQIFSAGGALHDNAVAQKYGGHQFGHWNPDLGDGRGLLLAEVTNKKGELQDLHLKGAGQTPYSRFGDGRAVLRSTLREYLASEALHHLGIPSSRALCLFTSSHPVQREELESAAMLIRSAPSHIRFGHFEYFFHTQQKDKLQQLFDFVFKTYFPSLCNSELRYADLLQRIVIDTARLIAWWQAYGFCHGVMNTDNMSIHGITFDYGPYGFLDNFQPDFVCNHSDSAGRYAFDQQPGVALWNLNALAYAFSDHLEEAEIAEILSQYEPTLLQEYSRLMASRFGFLAMDQHQNGLLNEYMQQMEKEQRDFNLSFRILNSVTGSGANQPFLNHFIDQQWAANWLTKYLEQVNNQDETEQDRHARMNKVNPIYVLRNYFAQRAIEHAEQGEFSFSEKLLAALRAPFDEKPEYQEFSKAPPATAQCVALSCSS